MVGVCEMKNNTDGLRFENDWEAKTLGLRKLQGDSTM
jgi:hypothetical protein